MVPPSLWDRFSPSTAGQGVQQTVSLWSTAGPWQRAFSIDRLPAKLLNRGWKKKALCRCCKRETHPCTKHWSRSPAAQHTTWVQCTSTPREVFYISWVMGQWWDNLTIADLAAGFSQSSGSPHCVTAPLSPWSTPLTILLLQSRRRCHRPHWNCKR